MRRAFTLVELLVIIAIIAAMVTTAVISVQKGQEYARMRGAVRDVFAAVRQARSIALVSQKPSVITFSSKMVEESVASKVEISSARLVSSRSVTRARSLGGEWRDLAGGGDDSVDESSSDGGGQTLEDILFEPISDEVLSGICIKVVMEDEEFAGEFGDDQARRSVTSVFSNVDFLLGNFRKDREKKAAEAAKDAVASAEFGDIPEVTTVEDEKSVAWQVNGRCEAHTIYIYPEGGDIADAWRIRVDRFGGVKVLERGDGE